MHTPTRPFRSIDSWARTCISAHSFLPLCFPIDLYRKYFSSKSLVPPEISGLVPAGWKVGAGESNDVRIFGRPRNAEILQVVVSKGIRYVTGDSSR